MIFDINWPAVAAIVGITVAVSGFVVWLLRARLSVDFASGADVAELSARMGKVEAQLQRVPTHDDLQGVAVRLAAVEARLGGMDAGLAVIGERVSGLREGMARIERDLGLFLQAAVNDKGPGKP